MSAATPIATKLRRGAIRDDVQSGEMDGQQSGSSHVLDDDLKALRAYHAGNRADSSKIVDAMCSMRSRRRKNCASLSAGRVPLPPATSSIGGGRLRKARHSA